MTARIVLLMAAVIGLAACESTKVVSTTPTAVATAPAPAPESRPIYTMEPIADDVVAVEASSTPKARKRRASAPVVADSTPVAEPDPVVAPEPEPAKPAKPEKTAKVEKPAKTEPAPVTTADATPPASPPTDATTPPTDSAPTPADTAPESGDTATTEVATADGAGDTAFDPKRLLSDPASVMKMQVAGFPVWLLALVGLIILAALIIGFGGRRKSEEVV